MAGATHAFGIPGGEVLALVDALERAGIGFHLAKHENAAGFMAEGHWHVTGALPVLVATLGPRRCQCGQCHRQRTAGPRAAGLYHRLRRSGAWPRATPIRSSTIRPCCARWSRRASAPHPGQRPSSSRRRWRWRGQGRPGPVHIDLPISATPAAPATRRPVCSPPAAQPSRSLADLSEAAGMIGGSAPAAGHRRAGSRQPAWPRSTRSLPDSNT